jgi:hypothetical protein
MPYSELDPLGKQVKVDPWFLVGGTSLAFVARSVNIISLCYFHVPISHMTGIVTDPGVLIGQALKHRKVRAWKIGFLTSILLGFFSGGLAGFLAFGRIGYYSIFMPAAMCLTGAKNQGVRPPVRLLESAVATTVFIFQSPLSKTRLPLGP